MILHAAVALVPAGGLELQPPPRTTFAKLSGDTVEACLRDAQRTPQALFVYARLNRLALNPASRDRAIAALEALASGPRTANRARLYIYGARTCPHVISREVL
jgi:hypothetical protein